jgi:hypothetical protein
LDEIARLPFGHVLFGKPVPTFPEHAISRRGAAKFTLHEGKRLSIYSAINNAKRSLAASLKL